MIRFFAFLCIFMFAKVAFGQEVLPEAVMVDLPAECTGILCSVLKGFPELNAWLIAVFTFIGLFLRASADLLAFVGKKIANKSASDMGLKLASFAMYSAKIVGWFGGGTPKLVLEQAVEKKMEAGKSEQPK